MRLTRLKCNRLTASSNKMATSCAAIQFVPKQIFISFATNRIAAKFDLKHFQPTIAKCFCLAADLILRLRGRYKLTQAAN